MSDKRTRGKAKPALIDYQIQLSENQMRKLAKGETIQIKHHHISVGTHLKLKEKKVKDLEKKKRAGKGSRLSLTNEELEGSGIGRFFNKLKSVGKKISEGYKEHVRDTPVGRQVRGGVKKAISQAIKRSPDVISGIVGVVPGVGDALAPVSRIALQKVADRYADQAGEMAVDKMGLGLKSDLKKLGRKLKSGYNTHIKDTELGKKIKSTVKSTVSQAIKKAPSLIKNDALREMASDFVDNHADRIADSFTEKTGLGLRSDLKKAFVKTREYIGGDLAPNEHLRVSYLFNPQHPAMNPSPPFFDHSVPRRINKKGGSFKPVGY